MTYKSIDEIFEAFRALKVLVVGDVMLDTYVYGSVTRISPEAPVPVVNVSRRENRIGGAGNVALNIQSLGATPILCSVVGNDPEAAVLSDLMQRSGLDESGLIRSRERITTVKNRIISASQHLLRVDSEIDAPLSAPDQKALLNQVSNLMDQVDLVIFEDYDKGCLAEGLIAAVIQQANKKGIPTAVDPKRRNFFHYNGCTLFKPNLKELKEGLGKEIDPIDIDTLSGAVGELADIMRFENVLVTLSEKGVFYQSQKGPGLHGAHVRSIADVSGAGDTVISIVGLCLALGLPLSFAAELSNLGGGIVCEYQGVQPIQSKRLREEAANNRILVEYLG